MASFYLDASALLKLYVEEEGTTKVLSLARGDEENRLVILDLTPVEARSAIRRREREDDIPGSDASLILKQIEEDRVSLFLIQPSGSEVIEEAARLLDRHPLKAYDAIQLAGCLAARYGVPPPVTFVCADARLCDAARLEGLSVLNPLEIG